MKNKDIKKLVINPRAGSILNQKNNKTKNNTIKKFLFWQNGLTKVLAEKEDRQLFFNGMEHNINSFVINVELILGSTVAALIEDVVDIEMNPLLKFLKDTCKEDYNKFGREHHCLTNKYGVVSFLEIGKKDMIQFLIVSIVSDVTFHKSAPITLDATFHEFSENMTRQHYNEK